eukprot:CAMPEP_0202035926 /NCGR_PEP_ID=MMETSP0962-20130828/1229_1 /ASSEMBLY_ACC=CAM_ASM_000488 /TAXON_ID=4773 /ORGANISM="Schizochytrium aggregatum, Strain ATCC28209" /LENGTH=106 /DNA_ID=CAMNT_0048599979 /DNA_START=30 /DNA_END=350 /DNA_ORIENTATION=+
MAITRAAASTMASLNKMLNNPHLLVALAGPQRSVKAVFQRVSGANQFKSVLQGNSTVKANKIYTKTIKASVYRPVVQKLSTPAFVANSTISTNIVKFPRNPFLALP